MNNNENNKMLQQIKQAYELSKVMAGFALEKGRPISDVEFAKSYGIRSSSMIPKTLSGKVVSRPVIEAVLSFIKETDARLYESISDNALVQEYEAVTQLQTQEEA